MLLHEPSLSEAAWEKLLVKALADGAITQYDAGCGRFFWFEGPPGPAMRALKKAISDLVTDLRARAGLTPIQVFVSVDESRERHSG